METQLLLFGVPEATPAAAPAADPILEAFRRIAPDLRPSVVYARARRRIFSWRRDPHAATVALRLACEFRAAPAGVAEALVRIVTRRRLHRDVRRRLFFEIRRWLAGVGVAQPPPAGFLPPLGRHVDLGPILQRVRAERLPAAAPVGIGWSLRPARHLMGRFEGGSPAGVIVINRLLDSPIAPHWYLDFLVFHELLHAVIPPRAGKSRILMHPPEFRREERRHPALARARKFERWASTAGFRLLKDPAAGPDDLPCELRSGG